MSKKKKKMKNIKLIIFWKIFNQSMLFIYFLNGDIKVFFESIIWF